MTTCTQFGTLSFQEDPVHTKTFLHFPLKLKDEFDTDSPRKRPYSEEPRSRRGSSSLSGEAGLDRNQHRSGVEMTKEEEQEQMKEEMKSSKSEEGVEDEMLCPIEFIDENIVRL